MTLNDQLKRLADQGGEMLIGPDTDIGQDLESFQNDVRRLRALADDGLIEIIRDHQESSTGQRYIDRVQVRLSGSADELRKALA